MSIYNKGNKIYKDVHLWTSTERVDEPQAELPEPVKQPNWFLQNVNYKFNVDFTLPRWFTILLTAVTLFLIWVL